MTAVHDNQHNVDKAEKSLVMMTLMYFKLRRNFSQKPVKRKIENPQVRFPVFPKPVRYTSTSSLHLLCVSQNRFPNKAVFLHLYIIDNKITTKLKDP